VNRRDEEFFSQDELLLSSGSREVEGLLFFEAPETGFT